jgi:hypothetical protein
MLNGREEHIMLAGYASCSGLCSLSRKNREVLVALLQVLDPSSPFYVRQFIQHPGFLRGKKCNYFLAQG